MSTALGCFLSIWSWKLPSFCCLSASDTKYLVFSYQLLVALQAESQSLLTLLRESFWDKNAESDISIPAFWEDPHGRLLLTFTLEMYWNSQIWKLFIVCIFFFRIIEWCIYKSLARDKMCAGVRREMLLFHILRVLRIRFYINDPLSAANLSDFPPKLTLLV